MASLRLTKKQADLVGASILAKIHKDRDAIDMITNEAARRSLEKEISDLNCILSKMTTV